MFYRVSKNSPLGRVTVRQCARTKKFKVVLKGTTARFRKQRTWVFADKASAESWFQSLEMGAPEALSTFDETVGARLQDAEKVLKDPNRGYSFPRTICLAIAMVHFLSSAANTRKSHLRYTRVADLLMDFNTLPTAEGFDDWLSDCLTRLFDGAVAKKTIRERAQIFGRACIAVEQAPGVFGNALSTRMREVQGRIKNITTLELKKAPKQKNFQPLSLAEIRNLLDDCPNVASKMQVLKSLASGLRPPEVTRLQIDFIESKKIRMDKIVTKVQVKGRPEAGLLLHCILLWQSRIPTLVPQPADLKWFTRESGVAPYRLRSTFAAHQVYSGMDPGTVADKLGHTDMTMVIKHYAKNRPPGAGDEPRRYYNPDDLVIAGYDLKSECTLYEQYLFCLTLDHLSECLGAAAIRDAVSTSLGSAVPVEPPRKRVI